MFGLALFHYFFPFSQHFMNFFMRHSPTLWSWKPESLILLRHCHHSQMLLLLLLRLLLYTAILDLRLSHSVGIN